MIAIEELEDEEHTVEVELAVRDLHCRCPFNGLQDGYDIVVRYQSMRGRVLELAAFRTLVGGFDEVRINHEALTHYVLVTIIEQIHPSGLEVVTTWTPVEGVECVVRVVA